MLTLPSLTTQATLIDAGRFHFIAGIFAHRNGWHCHLTPSCPHWMGCDCPPWQPISQRPRGRR